MAHARRACHKSPAQPAFLRACEGTIGGESGTYYLDRRGELLARAKAFVSAHPNATLDEVHDRFFRHPAVAHVSGKCISSRHFEAIGLWEQSVRIKLANSRASAIPNVYPAGISDGRMVVGATTHNNKVPLPFSARR